MPARRLNPARVSAVLVTKGDHDLSEIYESLEQAGVRDVVTWDNSKRDRDLSCYGRYAGVADAKHQWIFHQDDDLVAPVAEVIAAVDPVKDRWRLVSNNRADEEWLLTGIGTVFHRSLLSCFDRYLELYGDDFADFCRVSDVVFAYQWPYRRISLGYYDLPWGTAPDRMYHQPGHMETRQLALTRVTPLAPPEALVPG